MKQDQTPTSATNRTQTDTKSSNESITTDPMPAKRKDNLSIVTVVMVAVVIAVGLITFGFLVYNAKDEPAPTKTASQTEASDVLDTTTPANTQAVDDTVKEIDDSSTDLDNNSDFNESSLSDSSLGL